MAPSRSFGRGRDCNMARFPLVSTAPVPERAVLVGVEGRPGGWPVERSLDELERLADTAGAETVARISQRLDRPNPLGGLKVEGCVAEDGLISFVGQYKIPYIYGLTVGELARLINEEGLNCGQTGGKEPSHCNLTVIPMTGWTRDMLYADTGLPWLLPSPNIPTAEAAINYSAAGICGELYNYLNIGIGYTLPFGVFGATWIDAEALKAELDSYCLPGVEFRTIYYKPFSGSSAGQLVKGVQYFFTDYEAATVTLTQFYVMQAVTRLYPDKKPFETATGVGLFDKVCGTSYIRTQFGKSCKVSDIEQYWNKDVADFKALSCRYWLY